MVVMVMVVMMCWHRPGDFCGCRRLMEETQRGCRTMGAASHTHLVLGSLSMMMMTAEL